MLALAPFGADSYSELAVEGEHWRLLIYMLLHGGLMHLGFNMWALWSLGRHVELIYGPLKTAFIYVAAGVVGGMASTMLRPEFVPSVGASGAIFGLMGALLYFTVGMGRAVGWCRCRTWLEVGSEIFATDGTGPHGPRTRLLL